MPTIYILFQCLEKMYLKTNKLSSVQLKKKTIRLFKYYA